MAESGLITWAVFLGASSLVLLVLPFALLFIMMLMNDVYARAVAQHPNMLLAIAVAEGFGALWIRKIVNFDF